MTTRISKNTKKAKKKKEEPVYLFSFDELLALHRTLVSEYISYKDQVAYNLVKQISEAVNEELVRRASLTT
jgi:hypothetical protein